MVGYYACGAFIKVLEKFILLENVCVDFSLPNMEDSITKLDQLEVWNLTDCVIAFKMLL